MAQLDRRIRGRFNFAEKFGTFLECLPRCFELAVVVLKDRDFVTFKTQRSETNAAILCVLKAISSAQIVGSAEIDYSRHSIELNAANQAATTGECVAQIAAAVFPLVAYKRHPFFPVSKAKVTGQRIHGVQGENSAPLLWLLRLLVIRQRGRLCAQQLWNTEAGQQ